MHRLQPNRLSEASPKICALECQNTFFPRSSSNDRSSNLQLDSRGRSKSHNCSASPFNLATTVRLNRLFEMPFAISAGVVSHAVPSLMLPSAKVIVIGSLGLAAISASNLAFSLSNTSTRWAINCGGGFNSRGLPTTIH